MDRLLTSAAVLLLALAAPAQEARYELGRRLRAFEAEWERVTDAEARKRVVDPLKKATTAFFTSNNPEAARQLDRARLALRDAGTPEAVLWASSCALRPAARLVDAGTREPAFTLHHFYKPGVAAPGDLSLVLRLGRASQSQPLGGVPAELKGWTESVGEGDHTLKAEVRAGKQGLATTELTLSLVKDLEARLKKLEKAVAELPADDRSVEALTARDLAQTLRALASGKVLETDYPAARLLAESEAVLRAREGGKQYYTPDRAGQFWLQVPVGSAAVPVRVQVPEGLKPGRPVPLVVALHGLGGSENMFFDGYANGAIARLCARRGWLLVATRNAGGLSDGLVAELGKRYPVDAKRVFLVGHSMGAGQAVRLVSSHPERFAGVAALGGGGLVTESDGIKKVAFFVGCGKEDFALPPSRALEASLKRAGVLRLVVKEYPDVEHLVVVSVALPEVFALFDEVVNR